MIRQLVLLLLFLCSLIVSAQDVIVKKDGSTILCKVTEIGKLEVKYKPHSNLDGPVYSVSSSEVMAINYENGKRETSFTLQPSFKKMKSRNTLRWVGGSALAALGCFCITSELLGGPVDVENDAGSWILFGSSLASVGAGTWLVFSAAKHQKQIRQMESQITQTSLYQYDFKISDESSLSLGINMLNDRTYGNNAVGVGVHYNF